MDFRQKASEIIVQAGVVVRVISNPHHLIQICKCEGRPLFFPLAGKGHSRSGSLPITPQPFPVLIQYSFSVPCPPSKSYTGMGIE